MASATSRKTELKLTNVGRASLEELRLDYEDFLRQRNLALWPRDDPRRKALVARRCATADDVARWVVEVHGQDGRHGPDGQDGRDEPGRRMSMTSIQSMPSMSSIPFAAIAANAAHTLIGVAMALLDRQIAAQAAAFEAEGGFTERLYRVRKQKRQSP
jgi:four helix bundle suffix protein